MTFSKKKTFVYNKMNVVEETFPVNTKKTPYLVKTEKMKFFFNGNLKAIHRVNFARKQAHIILTTRIHGRKCATCVTAGSERNPIRSRI
jgi:hypothetical protein